MNTLLYIYTLGYPSYTKKTLEFMDECQKKSVKSTVSELEVWYNIMYIKFKTKNVFLKYQNFYFNFLKLLLKYN